MKLSLKSGIVGGVIAIAVAILAFSLLSGGSNSSSPSGTATATGIKGSVTVNFAGSTAATRAAMTTSYTVDAGDSAWTAVQKAVGTANLTYQDYGGDLGILVTGLYGVQAQGNNYWEFVVNGKSSDVGVSGYIVKEGDKLEFRWASF